MINTIIIIVIIIITVTKIVMANPLIIEVGIVNIISCLYFIQSETSLPITDLYIIISRVNVVSSIIIVVTSIIIRLAWLLALLRWLLILVLSLGLLSFLF